MTRLSGNRRRWLLAAFAFAVVILVGFVVYLTTPAHREIPGGHSLELSLNDFAAISADGAIRVQVESTLAAVEARLGRPAEQTILSPGGGGAISVEQLIYPGLTIQYARADGTILAVAIRNRDYHTPRGITIGDREGSVLRAYGTPTYRFQGNLQYVLAPTGKIDRYQLTFVISSSRVSTIWAFIPVQ